MWKSMQQVNSKNNNQMWKKANNVNVDDKNL